MSDAREAVKRRFTAAPPSPQITNMVYLHGYDLSQYGYVDALSRIEQTVTP